MFLLMESIVDETVSRVESNVKTMGSKLNRTEELETLDWLTGLIMAPNKVTILGWAARNRSLAD
jgi:hypothetical protein